MNDRSGIDDSDHTTHSKKKPGKTNDEGRSVGVSEEGVNVKAPKGNVKVTPGGEAVYEATKNWWCSTENNCRRCTSGDKE